MQWLGLAGTIMVVALDVLIATVLCVYLFLQDVESTGFVCIATPCLPKSRYLTDELPPVYANALLANLNARESLRGRGYTQDGTISVNWSALRTGYNEVIVFNDPKVGLPVSTKYHQKPSEP
ncbi:hypothetical protein H0H81_002677 [Sphagnurus paluster]|uniref:Uncharacterized protein n=1 Tax=Sphagnurus paluster TaxID=117069 RepID=A0A9P7K4H7_9AGAR|nr:hypothetical protein H0H81_002677 [Sphagnurus paluster]